MDPVTHGLIGATASQSFAEKDILRYAALLGAAGGMLPDLDILISSPADPLLNLEFHRQFTHSLVFIPAGALLIAGLFWWFVRSELYFWECYLFSLLGIATAGIADMFTSYGVQLLWPFTTERFAWNLISIFDPIFSLGLIITVGFSLYKKKKGIAWLGLIWMTVYLLFAVTQKQKAKIAAQALAKQRNHFIERLIVKPTIGNELIWSTRYVSGQMIYADGVRINPLSDPHVYPGESAEIMDWQEQYSDFEGTVLYQDIQRFDELSEGILVAHPDHPNVIGDGRYAMLPISIKPLWGIKVDTTQPRQHVEFNTYRDASQEVRTKFKNMLLGRAIE
ncbi:metal-dependent hydrolase [Aliifodinibius sp. S!AR15-10]|uniref:metal-dependent hydrolase n=1 Tax=Aliifodinibius sp. S!AR15-10 TaxID=2950437 RepID=UPI0028611812|nr:metal-dependent hydrolase [Aliifodinibius sp. S!AR15-10]MDR8390143.1 metal-dependent hydrolase [Aliifodinibius sp. S!AR15-10]